MSTKKSKFHKNQSFQLFSLPLLIGVVIAFFLPFIYFKAYLPYAQNQKPFKNVITKNVMKCMEKVDEKFWDIWYKNCKNDSDEMKCMVSPLMEKELNDMRRMGGDACIAGGIAENN